MCGWCCGGTPVDKRGEAHERCAVDCYNAPSSKRLRAERDQARADRRDLVSRLGFGDNITEPMADNDTIVAWLEEQGRDAAEWREHEQWRNLCILAGHSEDEDCYEHDPSLVLYQARADLADLRQRVETLADEWSWHEVGIDYAHDLRALLSPPADGNQS